MSTRDAAARVRASIDAGELDKARDVPFPAGGVLDPRDPLDIARRYVAEHYTLDDLRTLHTHRGDVRAWNGSHYLIIEDAALRAGLYGYTEHARRPAKKDGTEPFRPTRAIVMNIVDALRAATHVDADVAMPSWLDGRAAPDPRNLLPCANGILDVTTYELHPHTPALFAPYALPYNFDPHPPKPVEWFAFLDSIWPDDPDAIAAVQEMFGYLLSGGTSQQKMFMLVGPKRSGKGTIARVLRAMMGDANVAGPTLSSLATNFGMQSLIDRPLAIVSDARLSGRSDAGVIVERLLSITGEDVLTVDRKNRDAWIGQLPTRIVMLTNELPRLTDTSGALASRFIVLTMQNSFYGREDTDLLDRLLPELPAILYWSMMGLELLRDRGRFVPPASSSAAVQEMEDLGSPAGAFVRDACVVETGAEIATGELYGAWTRWCRDRGQEHVSTEQVFSRDLRAVIPGLETAQRRSGVDRWRVFVGIRRRGIS